MELATLLEQNRETILAEWFDVIRETYPRVTSEFLASKDDQFGNPVGHAITHSIGPIFDQIVSTMDSAELLRALDSIIRIRSVQDFSPSEAVAFVFQLKTVIRGVTKGQLPERRRTQDALTDLESRIDRVALLAFEKYTECREKLYEIRAKEIKGRTMKLLERANAKSGTSDQKEEPIDDDV
jgi:hypothetical protein